MKKTLKACAALFAAGLLIAVPAVAQDAPQGAPQGAAPPPANEEPSGDDIITAAIGCAATYDYLLAKTPGDSKMREARDFAISVYKQYSSESDAEVAKDVVEADRLLVEMVNKGELTIAEVQPTCDAVFMAEQPPSTT